MASVPFSLPDIADEHWEHQYAALAELCGRAIPPTEKRFRSITSRDEDSTEIARQHLRKSRPLAGEELAEGIDGAADGQSSAGPARVMVAAAKRLHSIGGPTHSEFPSAGRFSPATEPNDMHRSGQV